MYIDILKKIVNHYEYYKNIAVNLEWAEFNSRYYDWFQKYPIGIYVAVCEFQEGYVKDNFEQAYMQTVLTYMAYINEFEEDFRNTPSDELLKYMTEAEDFYSAYITYEELRMIPVMEEYLINQIWFYAESNDVSESEINSVIPYVTGAENIEIGGLFCRDHTFISIKDNSIMLIKCGVWD